MEVIGTIYKVGTVQQVTDKFKKLELIVTTDVTSQYPQHIKIQFSQDKCNLADGLKSGDECKFELNLRGKLYTDKSGNENVITNLECWRVTKLGSTATQADEDPFGMAATNQPQSNPLPPAEADDLPF